SLQLWKASRSLDFDFLSLQGLDLPLDLAIGNSDLAAELVTFLYVEDRGKFTFLYVGL
ncbi:hypothetical protein U1Q18_034162, partial [Sarracenia purpurea var. burkii]